MANDERTIARLAGGVAHDFNNLLTSIRGLSALALQELPADHPTRADLEEIGRAAQRAVALTTQLLALSGRNVQRGAAIDLNEAVRKLEPSLRSLVDSRARLDVRYASGPPALIADGRHIEQMLSNLLEYARDSAGPGGTVDVELGREAEHAVVIVRDSGGAVAPDDLINLFEPFWTTQDGRKLGLALAAAASLAKVAGGNLTARAPDDGSPLLELRLPLTDAAEHAASVVSSAAGTTGATILVVDDDSAVGRIVERILKGAGYRVLLADSAERALALAEEAAGAIDLLLTDVVMPGMGGPELQAALRQRWPRVRVLYMSGYTDDPAVRRQAGSPAGAYLSKPFGPDVLLATIRQALDREP